MKVGIAGAGLLGRLVALDLIDRGIEVVLVDGDTYNGKDSCGYAGAGMLAPFSELGSAEPLIHQMGVDSLPIWKDISRSFETPIFFQDEGSLIVAHPSDRNELDALHGRIMRRLPSPIGVEWVDRAGIQQLEPQLDSRFNRAIYLPFEGQVSSRAFFEASTLKLRKHTQWHANTPIKSVTPQKIQTQNSAFHVDIAIDCRGLAGRQYFPQLRGVRGELLRIHAPDVHINRPVRLMHPRYPLYVVPRPDQIYLVGATMIESDDMSPITAQSAMELLSAAFSLHVGFAEGRILEQVVHCRPALPDNLPQVQIAAGLATANGLYRHGYLIGPALAKSIGEWVQHQSSDHYPQIFKVCT